MWYSQKCRAIGTLRHSRREGGMTHLLGKENLAAAQEFKSMFFDPEILLLEI